MYKLIEYNDIFEKHLDDYRNIIEMKQIKQ